MDERKIKDKKKYIEEAFLNYFNRTLLKEGVITKEEYRLMAAKIQARTNSR